eukprot:1161989-Rhodomonas_salina.3
MRSADPAWGATRCGCSDLQFEYITSAKAESATEDISPPGTRTSSWCFTCIFLQTFEQHLGAQPSARVLRFSLCVGSVMQTLRDDGTKQGTPRA